LPPGHNPGIPEISNSVSPSAQAEVYPKKMIPNSSAPEYRQFLFNRPDKFSREMLQGKNINCRIKKLEYWNDGIGKPLEYWNTGMME